jgi:glycosyltransferase involved in cell wall biosynthesis
LHIGFDAKRAFHNSSGLGNYARTLLDNFSHNYPQVDLTLFTPGGAKVDWANANRYRVVNPTGRWKSVPSALWRSGVIALEQSYRQLDIFHGLSHELPYEFSPSRVKKVVTIHDLIAIKGVEKFPLVDRYIYRQKIEHALKVADMVVAISEQTKEDLMEVFKYPAERIEVIYQSCHPDYFSNFSAEKDNYLLYVGAFRERKNVLNLLRAFKIVLGEFPELQLILAGGGSSKYVRQMQELIDSLRLDQSVRIEFSPPFVRLKELYRRAKIFIYPSLYEGFGIPIIEALNSGTPVVTTKNSCMQEAGGEGGLYIFPEQVEDIAEKVGVLLKDDKLYAQKVSAGKKHMEQFSAVQTSAKLFQLYSDLY